MLKKVKKKILKKKRFQTKNKIQKQITDMCVTIHLTQKINSYRESNKLHKNVSYEIKTILAIYNSKWYTAGFGEKTRKKSNIGTKK